MFEETRRALAALIIYRGVLSDPVLQIFRRALELMLDPGEPPWHCLESWNELAFALYRSGHSFRQHLLDLILHDDNPFSRQAELHGYDSISAVMLRAVENDLRQLRLIYDFDFSQTVLDSGSLSAIPLDLPNRQAGEDLLASAGGWTERMRELAAFYASHSRGLVSRYRAFYWNRQQGLCGVDHPDRIRLDQLVGLESQREQLCRNTERFLQGDAANNVLLYGSRGTGKSSMIKALLNQYGDRGLTMVEVSRDDLLGLAQLVTVLEEYRRRFVIFIDDLSFEDYETEYKGLKAVLEGSLQGSPENVLIYATSNRRHLVREFFSDRQHQDEEIHSRDSMEEKLSLADRFGLTITFPTPGQQQYLAIVESMVRMRQLDIDPELLRRKALEWERAHHGPSGRTARQFVNSL